VTKVTTDMNDHTVTVTFDDEKQTIEAVVAALEDAGYVARNPEKLTE